MRRSSIALAAAATLAVGVVVASSAGAASTQLRWVITDLGTLGGPGSWPTAINERGQIVGYSSVVGTTGRLRRHAFLWENGGLLDLGALPGYRYSEATDINERGQIVGRAWNTSNAIGEARAFLWENGTMRDLGSFGHNYGEPVRINDQGKVLATRCKDWWTSDGTTCTAFLWDRGRLRDVGGKWSYGTGLSESGQVIGLSASTRDREGEPIWHAFLWENGTMQSLGASGRSESAAVDLNGRGEVIGCRGSVDYEFDPCYGTRTAVLWRSGVTHTLGTLGGNQTEAVDINDRGQVVGGSRNALRRWRAFLWHEGTMRDLGTLGGTWARAYAVNEQGQIVGDRIAAGSDEQREPPVHAFVWQRGRLVDLGGLIDTENSEVVAISNEGWIVGSSRTTGGETHAVLWTPKR